jgi:hypothetical protein
MSKLFNETSQADISALELLGPFGNRETRKVANAEGEVVASLAEGSEQDPEGKPVNEINKEGQLKDQSGSVISKADLASEAAKGLEKVDEAAPELIGPFNADSDEIKNAEGEIVAKLSEGEELYQVDRRRTNNRCSW